MEDEEKKLLKEKGYETVKFRASDFLPDGKLSIGDKIINLHEKDFHIEYMGKLRQLIAVFDTIGVLAKCPICKEACGFESYVVMTDAHLLYPCWSCDKLIERMKNDDLIEALV
tara:strand:- start:526 stop:864 length:339 start_codon:yes stop_codon:yes gene_type:complete